MVEGRDTQEAPASSTDRVATGAKPFDYSAFIVYADEDETFVKNFLVPALALDPRGVLLCGELSPGAPTTSEIERGVTNSAVTVAVLSPAYLRDRMARLTDEVAGYASATGAKLVPLLLAPREVPLSLKFRVMLDFRDKAQWPEEAKRLRDLLRSIPVRPQSVPPSPRSCSSTPLPAILEPATDRPRLRRNARVLAIGVTLLAGCAIVAGYAAARSHAARSTTVPSATVLIVPDKLMTAIKDHNGYPDSCILYSNELAGCQPYRWCVRIKGVGTFPLPKEGVFFGRPEAVAEVARNPRPISCAEILRSDVRGREASRAFPAESGFGNRL